MSRRVDLSRLRPAARAGAWLGALVVLLLACATLLPRLGEPRGALWDESYYITSTERYRQGVAQFASHPPLGLMLIAAGELALGQNEALDTAHLGAAKKVQGKVIPKGYRFAGGRIASALAGVLAALAFYGLLLAVTRSAALATVFSLPALLETAFIAQYRAAHLDAFQVLFATLMLLGCAIAARRGRLGAGLAFGVGLAAGAAALVKASGAVLLIAPALVLLLTLRWGSWPRFGASFARAAVSGVAVLAGVAVAVAAVYATQVAVSPKPPVAGTAAGKQDARHLSAPYRAYLEGRRGYDPVVVANATWDSFKFVSNDLEHMATVDRNASNPLRWPVRMKPVSYRWDSVRGVTRYVQFVGNPVTAGIGLVGLALAPLLLAVGWRRASPESRERGVQALWLLGTWLVFMAVHVWLGSQRVMYGYHYFIGLLISLSLAALAFDELRARWGWLRRWRGPVLGGVAALTAAAFAFYAPLALHAPLDRAGCELRNTFGKVVICRP